MMSRAHAVYADPKKGDEATLIAKYSSLIDRAARTIATRVGSPALFDDLWSVGALGLLDAAGRYDAERGVRFESFAEHRIRGAMIDELRRMDHLPRRLRAQTDKVQKAKRELAQNLGRPVSTEEIAEHLDMDVQAVDNAENLTQPQLPIEEQLLAHMGPNADDEISHAQMLSSLTEAITALPERLRTLMGLHYLEGFNYREIAKILGVSEPRVCQLHAEAIGKLRDKLTEHA